MLVGTTIAYFSSTKQMTNTFTSGNVEISFSEAAVKRDAYGNYVEDTEARRVFGGIDTIIHDYGKVYPGQSIYKDPTIVNTGTEPEWIAAKVVFTDGAGDLTKIMGYEGYEDIDIEVLLSGGLLDEEIHFGTWNGYADVCHNDRYAMIQVPNAAAGEYAFYFLMLQPVAPGEKVVIFDHISFPPEWNNSEMQNLNALQIHVQAFGVQTLNLDSCLKAMLEAFPNHFVLH
jgi:predicted ribosomally synthesized peptide with SipW-like signal peptide